MTIAGPDVHALRVLHGLKLRELDDFLQVCIPAQVPAGTLLIAEGDEDRSMVFLRTGALEVFLGQPPDDIVLARLDCGTYAGAVGLLRLVDHRMASVRTSMASDLLILERAGLEKLDAMGNSLVSNLEVDILRALIVQLREVMGHLVRLSDGQDQVPPAPGQNTSMWDRLRTWLVGENLPKEAEPEVSEAMQVCPELRGLPPDVQELLLSLLTPVPVAPGERLCEFEGDVGDAYLVVTGSIRLVP